MRPPVLRHCGFLLLILLSLLCGAPGQAHAARVIHESGGTQLFRPALWQYVLTEGVSQTDIDFDKLKLSPKHLLQYLDQLKQVSPVNHPEAFASLDEVAAYWVNAHNALALRLILDRYPTPSVKTIPNFMTDRRYAIGGVPTSLSDIEALIAKRFNHYPGIFFAITTLTKDAPPLSPDAYQGVTFEKQLKQQAARYLQDPTAVSTFHAGTDTCLGLRLGNWFDVITPGLQQALMFQYPSHGQWSQAETLAATVKPYLSPSEHVLMNVHCPHPVQLRAANPLLRKVERTPQGKPDASPK